MMVGASSFISIAVTKVLEDWLCCWWSTAVGAIDIYASVVVQHVVITLFMEQMVAYYLGNRLTLSKGAHAQRAFCVCSYVSEDRVTFRWIL